MSLKHTEYESFFIYCEQQIKREVKAIHMCGCRCNERLKVKTDGSTRNTSRIHWVPRGTGTPTDRDEVNKREFWVCDG